MTALVTFPFVGKSGKDVSIPTVKTTLPMGLALGKKQDGLLVLSAADEATAYGLNEGDKILQVENVPVQSVNTFRTALSGKQRGDAITMLVQRGDATISINRKFRGDLEVSTAASDWTRVALAPSRTPTRSVPRTPVNVISAPASAVIGSAPAAPVLEAPLATSIFDSLPTNQAVEQVTEFAQELVSVPDVIGGASSDALAELPVLGQQTTKLPEIADVPEMIAEIADARSDLPKTGISSNVSDFVVQSQTGNATSTAVKVVEKLADKVTQEMTTIPTATPEQPSMESMAKEAELFVASTESAAEVANNVAHEFGSQPYVTDVDAPAAPPFTKRLTVVSEETIVDGTATGNGLRVINSREGKIGDTLAAADDAVEAATEAAESAAEPTTTDGDAVGSGMATSEMGQPGTVMPGQCHQAMVCTCGNCYRKTDKSFTLNRMLYGDCYDPVVNVGGWLSAGYHSESNDLFNDRPDELNLHQGWLFMEKAATDASPWGFRADIVYGIDGADTQAFGNNPGVWDFDNGFDHGSYAWAIPQLYGEIKLGDWNIKAGHFFTVVGYEGVAAPGNFFYSHSMTSYLSEPFTHTGAIASREFDKWTVYAGWTLGWDTGFDQLNSGNNWLGGFSYDVMDGMSLTYLSSVGNLGSRGDDAYFHSLVLNMDLTDKLQYVVQSDVLRVDSTGEDNFGINQYLLYTMSDKVSVGARMEWWKGDVLTGYAPHGGVLPADGSLSYYAATFGVNYRPKSNLVLRPEVRVDWSPAADYDEAYFGIDAIYSF